MRVSLKSLRAIGLPAEEILRLVEEQSAHDDEANRQRQRRYRERLANKNKERVTELTSRDVTNVTETSPPSPPPSMVSPITPSLTTPTTSPSSIGVTRGKRLPEEWKPNARHYASGAELGLSPAQVDEAATDMRLWAEANCNRAIARKASWDKTFAGWLRRNTRRHVNGKHGGSIAAAADRLIAAAEAEEGGTSARDEYDLDL